MTTPVLSPHNDLAFVATLRVPDATGRLVPATPETSGAPRAFIADSSASDAEAAHESFETTPVYTGRAGRWLVTFDAAALDKAQLVATFGAENAPAPFVIIVFADDVRVAVPVEYADAKIVSAGEA